MKNLIVPVLLLLAFVGTWTTGCIGRVAGGEDAGLDGSTDAGLDANTDGGSDASTDASTDADIDAGSDAGADGGADTPADGDMDTDGDGSVDPVQETPGPRPVDPTPLEEGTLFASPAGSGDDCTEAMPCDIWRAAELAQLGDVVFLRGGSYDISRSLDLSNSGSSDSPILFESYPGEAAILDGSSNERASQVFIRVPGSYVVIRRIEIVNMPRQGLYLRGNNNRVEGVEVHGCSLSGIQVFSSYDYPYGEGGSYNTIQDCTVYDNSDAGSSEDGFADGGNADGISISAGLGNVVRHCLVYNNSDDGVDTWRSDDSYIGYVITHGAGIADGNGHGIKAGGAENSRTTLVEHCLSYANRASGFTYNSATNARMLFNTAFANGSRGYYMGSNTLLRYNIAADNVGMTSLGGLPIDNSWQRDGMVEFVSTESGDSDFLYPTPDGGFDDIGAFAGSSVLGRSDFPARPLFLIGDSTVDNHTDGEAGWGNVLSAFAVESTLVKNRARSGESSLSFHTNLWSGVRNDLSPSSLLLIQFAHNDEHDDAEHHTDPGTAPDYEGSYRDYLTLFINEARASDARPILISPVSRMVWNGDHPQRSHGEYPNAMRAVASDLGVKLLDLEQRSWEVFDTLGEEATVEVFSYDDRTHFTPEGAMRVAQMLKDLACETDEELCGQFLP